MHREGFNGYYEAIKASKDTMESVETQFKPLNAGVVYYIEGHKLQYV